MGKEWKAYKISSISIVSTGFFGSSQKVPNFPIGVRLPVASVHNRSEIACICKIEILLRIL